MSGHDASREPKTNASRKSIASSVKMNRPGPRNRRRNGDGVKFGFIVGFPFGREVRLFRTQLIGGVAVRASVSDKFTFFVFYETFMTPVTLLSYDTCGRHLGNTFDLCL